ncbi:mechanosensitive ion channel protein MscS [Deinococcus aerolatus]|uniref:Mechanosensitive ion channel protein MscS n=1 Tax=Deinococcus aerolatus TaxID=522487 RepID=A0ABQ2G037_9DEIO|nr:mechanosensitive ion channel family protein [Deinococcus aerolatus]GGL68128.1 mechanosensitive ion channel protein MscS [Deinococcus aerolatus]
MLDILLVQLSKPSVWLWLAIALVISYAIHRFGRLLLRMLRDQIGARMMLVLNWLWLLVVVGSYVAYATYKIYLPNVPVLFALGQNIAEGFRNTAGQAVVIVALALIAWRMVGNFSDRIVSDDEFNRRNVRVQTLKGVVESTLKVIIIIISLIAALQALGVNATSLLAGVSVLGLAVGFGAQSLIKDVFTGFFILLEDQYGVGDVITVNSGTLSGNVEQLNLRVTVLRALDGTVHIVPNGQINTVSVSSKDWSRVVATVDVTYQANINEALRVLKAVSDELYAEEEWRRYFLEEPEIQGVTQLAPDGVTLRALYKVLPKSQYAVGREFNRRIKIAMDQAGIEIPFPQRSLNFGGAPIEIRLTRDDSGHGPPEQNRTQSPVKPSETRDPEEED